MLAEVTFFTQNHQKCVGHLLAACMEVRCTYILPLDTKARFFSSSRLIKPIIVGIFLLIVVVKYSMIYKSILSKKKICNNLQFHMFISIWFRLNCQPRAFFPYEGFPKRKTSVCDKFKSQYYIISAKIKNHWKWHSFLTIIINRLLKIVRERSSNNFFRFNQFIRRSD